MTLETLIERICAQGMYYSVKRQSRDGKVFHQAIVRYFDFEWDLEIGNSEVSACDALLIAAKRWNETYAMQGLATIDLTEKE